MLIKDFMIIYQDNDTLSDIEVEVTHYYVQKADKYADNPNDFYGYTDLDYEVSSITVYEFNEALMDYSKEGQLLMFPESFIFTQNEYERLDEIIKKELEST